MDNDVITVKSFDDMRIYSLAMSRATDISISNAIIVSDEQPMHCWKINTSDLLYNMQS